MSAPSDGARADARKRLAASVAVDEKAVATLADLLPLGYGPNDPDLHVFDAARRILRSDWLAGVIADAKAEALREAARAWPYAAWWGEFDDWLRARAESGR